MLRIVAERGWRRCPSPGCGHAVERTDGCNHVRCKCGCSFCYACGSAYASTEPTAHNVHGTAGCACPLFGVPGDDDNDDYDEDEDEEEDSDEYDSDDGDNGGADGWPPPPPLDDWAVPPPPPPLEVPVLHAAAPRLWRAGRQVSFTPCRHSISIHNCPYGPERCWFWHDEDEDYVQLA